MRRRLIPTALTAVALLTVAACGSSGSASPSAAGAGSPGTNAAASGSQATGNAGDTGNQATDKITVGAIPIVDVAPLYVGKKQGFFADQHIDVNIVNTTGGAAAVPGVVSGGYQFAFGNVVSLILARSQGLPLKAIAEGNSSTGKQGADFGAVVVPKDSPIKTAKDLVGKTVAVNNLKNVGDTTVRASIRKAGGDPKNVKFVELNFPDMPAAVANHRVDAAWVVEPFLTVAKQQGARVVAWNFVDAAPNMTVATYFTTEKMIQTNSDLTKRFTAAIEKSLQYCQDHPDAVRQILPTYTKIDAATAAKITLPSWPQKVNTQSVQTLADLMLQDGLISKKVDVTELLP